MSEEKSVPEQSKNAAKEQSNQMWGGRFESAQNEIMQQINASIGIDQRMWRQDIRGSKAHCEMLMQQKIIEQIDGEAILGGLEQISQEIESGKFQFRIDLEDIHMNIEGRLKEIIGDTAGRLHTARSRNDQVATDFRLWVKDATAIIIDRITQLQGVLSKLQDEHADSIMPGFTHLQAAQPITLGRHFQAYWEMLARDKSRFEDCKKRLNECPLGAAALAGTPFNIDREFTAKKLGFDKPMASTLDSVSARDFVNEYLFACAQTALHLSRLAEEIIIWATPQFGFIQLSDSWSTGSSIMPQKKNPDAAELIRAKTGRLNGNLVKMLTVMKALPLAYNKDMQEDKEPAFDSFDTLYLCLEAMNGMLSTAQFKTVRMEAAAEDGFTTATALADWLVMNLKIPFREAHHITGQVVKIAEEQKCKLHELKMTDMERVDGRITVEVFDVLRIRKEK